MLRLLWALVLLLLGLHLTTSSNDSLTESDLFDDLWAFDFRRIIDLQLRRCVSGSNGLDRFLRTHNPGWFDIFDSINFLHDDVGEGVLNDFRRFPLYLLYECTPLRRQGRFGALVGSEVECPFFLFGRVWLHDRELAAVSGIEQFPVRR